MRTPAPDLVPEDDQIRELVSLTGQRLNERQPEITRAMTDHLAHIDYLDGDAKLLALLEASVEGNVKTIFHVLINDISITNLQPTTAAVEYAERLAQRGVPANSLVRAYHMGQDDLMASCFEEAQRLDCDSELKLRVVHRISGLLYQYIDWICLYLLDTYEAEQARWSTTAGHVRTALLHALLAGDESAAASFEVESGYRLDQHHVGVVVWSEQTGDGVDVLREIQLAAARLPAANKAQPTPVFSAVDRTTAWLWLPRGRGAAPLSSDELRTALSKVPGARAAIGLPASGPDGFRRSHRQAEAARSVALAGGPHAADVLAYADGGVAVISMLTHDMDGLQSWVRGALGPLGTDTASHQRLRETVHTFFSHDRHHAATAAALTIHRNTLKYRLEKAETIRGRPLDADRLDLELALQVCQYLGAAVLE